MEQTSNLITNFSANFNTDYGTGDPYWYWLPRYPEYKEYFYYYEPTYRIEPDKMKQAIEVTKVLLKRKMIKGKIDVKEYIDLVDAIYKVL